MQWYEILVIVLAAAFVIGVCVFEIIRKKKGKGGCDCCGECTHCSHCKPKGESGQGSGSHNTKSNNDQWDSHGRV